MSETNARRVLITGGSRGIGRACVEYFRAMGDHVCLIYHNSTQQANELCTRTGATALQADLGDPLQASSAAQAAIDRLGGIDILVSNAGIAQLGLFTELTDSDWRRMLDVNLSAAFYVTRTAARVMVAQHSGRILFIGSVWGRVGASCEAHYSAAKAGLRGLTLSLAKELGPSGITVNCIEPGVIATEMNAQLDAQTLSALQEETPLGRLGTPEEVAQTVGFLASGSAAFITGQCLGIDGGFAL